MRYRLRRILPGSALRVGCALGWLVALPPALCAAGLVVRLIAETDQALGGLKQAEIVLPTLDLPVVGEIELGRVPVDLSRPLGLDETARNVAQLADQAPAIFLGTTLAAVAVGALILAAVALLFSLGYNLLASIGGGLELELRPEDRPRGRE